MAGLFCDSSSDDEFLALAAFTICAISRLKKKTKKKKGAYLTRRPFESHKLREEQLSRTSTRKVELNSQKIQTNQKEQVESPIHKEMEQTSERGCIASEIERWKEIKTILNRDKDEQFAQLQIDSFYATQSAQSSQDVQSVRPKVPADARASPPQNKDTKLHFTVTSDERGNPYPQPERCKETTGKNESLPQDHKEIVPLSIIKHERTGEQVLKVEIKNEPVQLIQPVQPVHEFYDGQELIRVIKQEDSDSESLPRNNEMGVDIKEEGADSCNPLGDETEMKATSYSPFKIHSTSTRHLQETDPENHVDILARPACNRITKFKVEQLQAKSASFRNIFPRELCKKKQAKIRRAGTDDLYQSTWPYFDHLPVMSITKLTITNLGTPVASGGMGTDEDKKECLAEENQETSSEGVGTISIERADATAETERSEQNCVKSNKKRKNNFDELTDCVIQYFHKRNKEYTDHVMIMSNPDHVWALNLFHAISKLSNEAEKELLKSEVLEMVSKRLREGLRSKTTSNI